MLQHERDEDKREVPRRLFADAELREDRVEEILGGSPADDLADGVDHPAMTTSYVPLARILIGQDQHDKALPHLQEAVKHAPDNAEVQYLLGACLNKQQQYDPALAAFTKATELDAELADAHFQRGVILLEQKKDIPTATTALGAAVALKGDDPAYLTQYGVALYNGKNVQGALEALSKAASTPDYADPLGLTYHGIALKDVQRYAEAAASFEKAIEAVPNWGLPHWGLAWSSFGQIEPGCPCGPEGEALKDALIEHANKAAELGTNDPALMERAAILGRGEKVR
jgi:tetratricopeptide (TPR) repeat protein